MSHYPMTTASIICLSCCPHTLFIFHDSGIVSDDDQIVDIVPKEIAESIQVRSDDFISARMKETAYENPNHGLI